MKKIFVTSIVFFGLLVMGFIISINSRSQQSGTQIKETNKLNDETQIIWTPGMYRGIKLGKSKYKDVIQFFGKPRWQGENEEKTFEEDTESEILLQYNRKGEGEDAAEIIIGKTSKIVKAISYIPYVKMTKTDAISQFGSNYYEINSSDSLCLKENFNKERMVSKAQYPILLVYPEKGMYILVGQDNEVMHIGFLYKCLEK